MKVRYSFFPVIFQLKGLPSESVLSLRISWMATVCDTLSDRRKYRMERGENETGPESPKDSGRRELLSVNFLQLRRSPAFHEGPFRRRHTDGKRPLQIPSDLKDISMITCRNAGKTLRAILFLFLFLPVCALAQTSAPEFSLKAFRTASGPSPVLAVLFFTAPEGSHIYGNTPGPSGFPTAVTGQYAAEELEALYPPSMSAPDSLEPGLVTEQYTDQTLFYLPVPAASRTKTRAASHRIARRRCVHVYIS